MVVDLLQGLLCCSFDGSGMDVLPLVVINEMAECERGVFCPLIEPSVWVGGVVETAGLSHPPPHTADGPRFTSPGEVSEPLVNQTTLLLSGSPFVFVRGGKL